MHSVCALCSQFSTSTRERQLFARQCSGKPRGTTTCSHSGSSSGSGSDSDAASASALSPAGTDSVIFGGVATQMIASSGISLSSKRSAQRRPNVPSENNAHTYISIYLCTFHGRTCFMIAVSKATEHVYCCRCVDPLSVVGPGLIRCVYRAAWRRLLGS